MTMLLPVHVWSILHALHGMCMCQVGMPLKDHACHRIKYGGVCMTYILVRQWPEQRNNTKTLGTLGTVAMENA